MWCFGECFHAQFDLLAAAVHAENFDLNFIAFFNNVTGGIDKSMCQFADVNEAWAFGATLKYQQQNVVGHKSGGLGMDVGVLVRPLVAAGHTSPLARSFRIGLAMRNLVEPTIRLVDEDVTDPLGLRLGTSLVVPLGSRSELLGAVDLEKTRNMDSHLHAGLELVMLELLALRVGSNDGTLAAGAGVVWRSLSVNYIGRCPCRPLTPLVVFVLGLASVFTAFRLERHGVPPG